MNRPKQNQEYGLRVNVEFATQSKQKWPMIIFKIPVNLIGKNTRTLLCQIHCWVKRVTYCHPLLGPLNTEQVGHGPNRAAPATHQKQKWRLKSAHIPWLETQQVKLWITGPDHLPETPAVHTANNEAQKWNWETDTETKYSKYLCIWQNDSKIHQTNTLVGWLRRE